MVLGFVGVYVVDKVGVVKAWRGSAVVEGIRLGMWGGEWCSGGAVGVVGARAERGLIIGECSWVGYRMAGQARGGM